MNSYLICPNRETIIESLKEYVGRASRGSGQKARQKQEPYVVSSRDLFDRTSFKELFKNPSDDDTVIIVPELCWDNKSSVDQGYEIALRLINEKLARDSFVNILFVSNHSQEQLVHLVDVEHVEMVKAFPHFRLSDIIQKDEPAPVPVYSKIHFELLKRVVVSRSGQLDFIKHRLSHLTSIDPDRPEYDLAHAKENLRKILEVLSRPSLGGDMEGGPGRIREFRAVLKEVSTKDDLRVIVLDLRQFIDDIKDRLASKTSFAGGESCEYRVLIVEDNPLYQKKLKDLFERCLGPKTAVTSWGSDEILSEGVLLTGAKERSASIPKTEKKETKGKDIRSRIEAVAGRFNIVIFDMMYSVCGNEDNISACFNGFDLYAALREAELRQQKRKAAIRIVTALPRNDISRLVKKHLDINETPIVFTKGNGWEQLEGCLLDRMDEIMKECALNQDRFIERHPFPKTGVFRRPGLYELIASNDEAFRRLGEEAKKIASKNSQQVDLKLPSATAPSKIWENLLPILVHRRLVVQFLMSESAPTILDPVSGNHIPYYDEELYRDFLTGGGFLTQKARGKVYQKDFGKTYLQTRLGFKVKALPELDDIKNKVNDGRLSKSEKMATFCRIIYLTEYLDFFKGELDSPEGESQPKALSWFIRKIHTMLGKEKNRAGFRLQNEFKDSGIDTFLQEKATVDTLCSMLNGVRDYLENESINSVLRIDLQNFFFDHFDLRDDEPSRYNKIKSQSKKVIELMDEIIDMEI